MVPNVVSQQDEEITHRPFQSAASWSAVFCSVSAASALTARELLFDHRKSLAKDCIRPKTRVRLVSVKEVFHCRILLYLQGSPGEPGLRGLTVSAAYLMKPQ